MCQRMLGDDGETHRTSVMTKMMQATNAISPIVTLIMADHDTAFTIWSSLSAIRAKALQYIVDKNFLKILEIWGKAQRMSARRPKSDWGRNLEG